MDHKNIMSKQLVEPDAAVILFSVTDLTKKDIGILIMTVFDVLYELLEKFSALGYAEQHKYVL